MPHTSPMPEFSKPPVSEVALSIEFAPIDSWTNNNALVYNRLIQARYPNMEIHPELPSQIEKFGEENFSKPPSINVTQVDPNKSRFWFLSEPPIRIIQVQRNRFIVNWRNLDNQQEYPRYFADIKPIFVKEFSRFSTFITDNQLGDIAVKQCEVTYVNDMPRGEQWNEPQDAFGLIDILSSRWGRDFLPTPEALSVTGSFLFPERAGRLYFSMNRAFRTLDKQEVYQLRLTARGQPTSSKQDDVLAWMDMAHEWIVRGFTDLSTEKAHKLWGRRK